MRDPRIEAVENGLQRRRQLPDVAPKNMLTRMQELNVPNASITMIEDGDIAWSRDYDSVGQTAVDQDRTGNAPVFQAGSISKTVNAVLAMKLLVETGKIKIDDDLTSQLTAMGIPNNTGKPITLAQLLSHTAGTTVHGFAGYATNSEHIPSTAEILSGNAELKGNRPDAKDTHTPNTGPIEVVRDPGMECVYSGGGTTIVQRLIETQFPGRTYASLAEEHIFRPLGMRQSTFELQRPGSAVAHIQAGHEYDGKVIEGNWRLHPESAAAGLWSTTQDLAKFAIAIYKMSRGEMESPILNRETVEQMLAQQPNSNFGLGFEVSGSGDAISFGHGGATIGYRADYIFFPQTQMGAVILTNSENGNQLIEGIYCSIAKNYGWSRRGSEVLQPVSLTDAELQKCVGEFTSPDGKVFYSKIVGEKLQLILPNFNHQERAELIFVPLSETKFFCVEHQFEVTFDADYNAMEFGDGLRSKRYSMILTNKMPIIEDILGDDEHKKVTFYYQAPESTVADLPVYLALETNMAIEGALTYPDSITEKDRLQRVPGTNIYSLSIDLPNNLLSTYSFRIKYDLCLMSDSITQLAPGKIYIGEKGGKLTYSMVSLNGESVLNSETDIPSPTNFTLEVLESLKDLILEAASKKGHTPTNLNVLDDRNPQRFAHPDPRFKNCSSILRMPNAPENKFLLDSQSSASSADKEKRISLYPTDAHIEVKYCQDAKEFEDTREHWQKRNEHTDNILLIHKPGEWGIIRKLSGQPIDDPTILKILDEAKESTQSSAECAAQLQQNEALKKRFYEILNLVIYVYLPKDHSHEGQSYPLILQLDGHAYQQMITDEMLDNMIGQGKIPPSVVVFLPPQLHGDRMKLYACNHNFNEFLATELIHDIRDRFHCSTEATDTFITGSSLGGLASLYAGLTHPEVFGNVISQSGALWHSREKIAQAVDTFMRQKGDTHFIMDAGEYESGLFEQGQVSLLNANREMAAKMREYNHHEYSDNYQYSEFPGGHSFLCWQITWPERLISAFELAANLEKNREAVSTAGTASSATNSVAVPLSGLLTSQQGFFGQRSQSESWAKMESAEKRQLLEMFWNERIVNFNQASVDLFKNEIIRAHFPKDTEWDQKIETLFSKAKESQISFDQFFNVLKHLPMLHVEGMAKFEKLTALIPEVKLEPTSTVVASDIINIKRYMDETNIRGAVSFGFADTTLNTPNSSDESHRVYAMHSVGKVFTGMLTLQMIQQGVIPEETLSQPLDPDFIALLSLPESTKKHLRDNGVTLHQLMTHHAGLGDYLENYCKVLEQGRTPNMQRAEDFLQFADEKTSPVGEEKYSNLGILLVGLYVKHAYSKKHGDYEYHDILQQQLIDKVGMPSFSSQKPAENAQFNAHDPVAALIAGSPAGGYWTTAEDLAKFGQWIYQQCHLPESNLHELIQKYGQEFYDAKSDAITHNGNIPSSSAHLSVSLQTGAVIATLSDQDVGALSLSAQIKNHVFSKPVPEVADQFQFRV